ncbi:MAG: adenine deaminase [Verrucomicrobiia bacterium]
MSDSSFTISGNIVDVVSGKIQPGTLEVKEGKIQNIQWNQEKYSHFVMPGFVDAHIHIESSMLPPPEFARWAVVHGTVATVSDPHEIGNVLGVKGVDYMIQEGQRTPFKFFFGAPSCVPATPFETAGATITADEIESLLKRDEVKYLSEMMNFPGVLERQPEVMKKIEIAQKLQKPIDGHAPGLRGSDAKQYASAGISTDHECFTKEEALDKIACGMKILIREGSAAKNFEALYTLIESHPDICMLCSDDQHPNELVKGHINLLVKRAIEKGVDPMKTLRAATLNPVRHYGLEVGLLQKGDPADFLLVDDLKNLNVLATYINGEKVAETGKSLLPRIKSPLINHFETSLKTAADFQFKNNGDGELDVIEALNGQLITRHLKLKPRWNSQKAESDLEQDILKITVVNRYQSVKPAIGWIKNFGLKQGAIASSVAHDSHNIVAVGVDDESLAKAVNLLIEAKGGISAASQTVSEILPLPIAGLMSPEAGEEVAAGYEKLDRLAKEWGSQLDAPFMTLAFMALLVIPDLKLSDRGLFSLGKGFIRG